jgi:hypothetical protein
MAGKPAGVEFPKNREPLARRFLGPCRKPPPGVAPTPGHLRRSVASFQSAPGGSVPPRRRHALAGNWLAKAR